MSDLYKKFASLSLLWISFIEHVVWCEIDYNTINEDGSFSFRHKNDDIGGYYHSASGSPDNNVRGRYGSRNPATGQVEEVVYSAGPRGFRANGPKIHRKMNLAQFPVLPRGSPDDPLADPYDDPTYSFKFRTPEQSRSEDNDAAGRVRGLYSYIDDVGERHSVRYAAGAGTGFEVLNATPDNPALVGYAAALYKAPPQTRGKMTVQRGPNGSYKLIAAAPDHRRAESRGTDGLVRGTYSYLDDKGVQRTVEYIAGAGIGYRVVQNSVGVGTHINPSVSDFRLTDTNFKLANDFGQGAGGGLGNGASSRRGDDGGDYLKSAGSDGIAPNDDNGSRNGLSENDDEGDDASRSSFGNNARNNGEGNRMGSAAGGRGGTRYRGGAGGATAGSRPGLGIDESSSAGGTNILPDRGSSSKLGGRGGIQPSSNRNTIAGERRGGANAERDGTRNRNRDRTSSSASGSRTDYSSSSSTSGTNLYGDNGGYNYGSSSSSDDNYNLNDDDVGVLPPLITANRKILEIDRERDWVNRHRDSTIIKNVGNWYIGLPPGQGVRAHVQNIDLLPVGGRRLPSPSEALRQDELADMVASLESAGDTSGLSSYRNSKKHKVV